MENENPYRADPYASHADALPPPVAQVGKLPVYCLVIFILDICFSAFRALAAIFGFVGYQSGAIPADSPLTPTVYFEVATGAGMALFGFIGGGLVLAKKRIGIPFAWLKVLFAAAAIGVSIWQLSLIVETMPNPASRTGAMIGGGVTVAIRLALLGAFVGGVIIAQRFFSNRDQ